MAIDYNQPDGQDYDVQKEVGGDVTLEITDGTEIAVTNVSFSAEANTSEVQYTTGYFQTIAVTGVTYSGSFEIAGNAYETRSQGWSDGTGGENTSTVSLPSNIDSMTITDGVGKAYTFTNVLLNSVSKDVPSDDRTSASFDFMAEKMYVSGEEEEAA
jgi:hypothetical protein